MTSGLIVYFLAIAACIIGLTAAVVLFVYLVKIISEFLTKKRFEKLYRTGKLPGSIRVKKRRNHKDSYYFILRYPHWSVRKKDGTADKRVKRNPVIWEKCDLYIDEYQVSTFDPQDMLTVVKRLRQQGEEIEMCREERKKYAAIRKKKEAFAHNNSIQEIVDYYMEKPTDFEGLCAELYESMGYTAKVTPPSNDGGYDILLKRNKETSIVECKCYSLGHNIGRPMIQKLVGANRVADADNMIFITTSEFSSGAVSYAEEAGVKLINGRQLIRLLDKHGFIEKGKVRVDVMECQLEPSDLKAYIPRDLYEMYFDSEAQ